MQAATYEAKVVVLEVLEVVEVVEEPPKQEVSDPVTVTCNRGRHQR